MSIELLNGDCLFEMLFLPDSSVDMVLTDPPYGKTQCKWDSVIPLEPMWEQLKRIIKPNGAIVLTASQPFTSKLIMSNINMFKYCLVWEKSTATGHLNAKKMPMKAHEDIVIFYRKLPVYNPQKTQNHKPANLVNENRKQSTEVYGKHITPKSGGQTCRYPRSVLKFKNVTLNTKHPTQKPVALMEYLIKTYTNEGETVLDFAAGSGTTGVACKNLNRNFIGIELDENYFDIGANRILANKVETK